MNKEFIKRLLKKRPAYFQVWAFLYSISDETDTTVIEYYLLLSKFKISRTTLRRIITDFGQEVDSKWTDNKLEVKFISSTGGQKVDKKRTRKTKPTEAVESCYKEMIAIYTDFVIKQIGIAPEINALQGKAMKDVIKFLKKQVLLKQPTLENNESELNSEILTSWNIILENWNLLDKFFSTQIKVNQISSNLPNIIAQIKSKSQNLRNAKYTNRFNEIGNLNFE
jgi:hypothetical protein